MNKLALASLFCLSAANAVEYVEVDDERCHSDPSTPVIEPSPSPSPYPDPPTPVDDWDTTHAPTASPTNPCEGWVESLTLIDAKSFLDGDNNQAVMGYEILPSDKVVQLPQDSRRYTIRANVAEGVNKVRFYVNGTSVRADSSFPYSLAGENSDWTPGSKIVGDYKPYWDFKNKAPNYWIIQARGYKNNQAEPMSDSCEVRIRIEDGVNDEVQVEENDSCKPAQIVPSQGGDYEYQSLPIGIVERVTNETVSFKVKNTIMTGQGMGWITTNYVTQSKVEVCDKVENVAWNEEIDHVYEVKCYDGFAFVDIFAHTNVFDATKATADSSSLPEECRDSVGEKVVKYSFVMSCDCEANPTVPPEIVPGVDPIPPRCKGITADTWGDPHINTWDGSQHWNCQEEGEFIMSKATLPDYDYDFELRSRFTQFDQPNLAWSFNSGMAVKQDVLVQINFDTEVRPHSNMFADVPVSFYVDGVARKFTEGSGDHRVLVTRDGYDVQIFFVETGIHVYVLIRPLSVDDHITTLIPGSMSTYVCFPEFMEDKITDITGLWGTPGGGVANDYKTPAGDIVSFGGRDYPTDSQGNEYCRTNWCVSDESKSFFTLEANQQWSDFDYCENPRNRRHLVESDGRELNADDPKFAALTPELWELCGSVDNNTACLEDALAFAPSTWGAEVAVESLWLETHLSPEEEATIFDDDACCSTDFKTCMTTPGCDKGVMDGTLCAGCVEDGTPVTFLAEGEYPFGDEGSFAGCSALGSACSDGCCPGLACGSDDTCVVDEGVRRLTHAEWSRPDHADERQVVPLRHAEL